MIQIKYLISSLMTNLRQCKNTLPLKQAVLSATSL